MKQLASELSSNVKTKLRELLQRVIPDREKCRATAAALRAAHPDVAPEELAEKAVATARKWAVAAGAATGAASSPFSMIPAALADVAAVLKLEGTMAGVIAAVLDPQSLDDPVTFETDVVSILFPAAASQALRQVAIRAGEQTTKSLIRTYVGKDMLKTSLKYAAEFIGMEITEKAIIAKSLPIVGAGIGAAWNWLEVRAVGKRAIRYHTGRPTTDKPFKPRALLPE